MNFNGSSPRPRGTGAQRPGPHGGDRFIPASAGNGSSRRLGPRGMPVHPRVRGERNIISLLDAPRYGSSPRPRGTVPGGLLFEPTPRFIPASAGNGSCRCCRQPSRSVHPRVRGERKFPRELIGFLNGSSPRPRGTAYQCGPAGRPLRFIPASAGNGRRQRHARASCAVHPRVRGERLLLGFTNCRKNGSSPRPRGTVSISA